MRKHYWVLSVLVLLNTVPEPLRAAVHCVRAGASGSGDGSDWDNAYTELPADLTRGDTYYIADGIYSAYTFDDEEVDSQYITIKKAVDGLDHGTDIGWQSGYGDGVAEFTASGASGVWSIDKSFYFIDGQVGGGPGSWDTGHGIKVAYYDTSYDGRIRLISLGGSTWGIPPLPNRITLTHIEIAHRGLDTEQADDGLYNAVQGVDGLYDEDLKNVGPQYVTVSHCYFHDFGRNAILSNRARYWLVEKNLFARNSSSAAIHSEGWQDFYSNDMVVRNNIWNDMEGTAYIALKKNAEYSSSNWKIYGNVFYRTYGNPYDRDGVGGDGIISLAGGGVGGSTISFHDNGPDDDTIEKSDGGFDEQHGSYYKIKEGEKVMVAGSGNNDGLYTVMSRTDSVITLSGGDALVDEAAGADVAVGAGYAYNISIFNNDFVNVDGLNVGFMTYGLGLENYAYNNIWYGNTGNVLRADAVENDYNWYYDNYRESPYTDLSANAAATEDNAVIGSADPFADWMNADFALKEAVPGITLDPEYSVDMFGNTRGMDGEWDRGAVEFVADGIAGPGMRSAYPAQLPNPVVDNGEYGRMFSILGGPAGLPGVVIVQTGAGYVKRILLRR